ncbi:hypothetical protein GCM10022415_31820 [Knoellia locipacati]|uniref:O-antigen ligase-related domain-containing protein n=1 Tax=Knoellia locipacati TaxID=882824 RepID=A0A512T3N1_9MICO|nr:O-antigen ligase family protein [Knoellia locipacati]GEQ14814.1 hypothetical protein KLO01_28610 [Knoellia locipacati]
MAIVALALWLVWAVLAAAAHGELLPVSSPYVLSTLALGGGVVLGDVVSRAVPTAHVAMGVVALVALLLVATLVSPGVTGLPLGYANANAALAIQAMALSGLLLVRVRPNRRWVLMGAVAAAFVVLALSRSTAATALAVALVPVLWWAAGRGSAARRAEAPSTASSRRAPLVAGLVSGAAAIAVVWLARTDEWPSGLEAALSTARHTLWRDALSGATSHPLVGVGPGHLAEVSSLSTDVDLGAAHSAVLQVGAETGWPGVVLLALLTGTTLAWASHRGAAAATIGSSAVAAFTVHAQIDHLLEFAPLLLLLGIVVGVAGAPARSEQLDVAEGERPVAGRGRGPGEWSRREDRSLPG